MNKSITGTSVKKEMLDKFTVFNIKEKQSDESKVKLRFSLNILTFAKIYIEYPHFIRGEDNFSTTKHFRF